MLNAPPSYTHAPVLCGGLCAEALTFEFESGNFRDCYLRGATMKCSCLLEWVKADTWKVTPELHLKSHRFFAPALFIVTEWDFPAPRGPWKKVHHSEQTTEAFTTSSSQHNVAPPKCIWECQHISHQYVQPQSVLFFVGNDARLASAW